MRQAVFATVSRLWEIPDQRLAAGLQDASHFRKRAIQMRHVAQIKCKGDPVEITIRERQFFRIAQHCRHSAGGHARYAASIR
jgi:hypothetical protein